MGNTQAANETDVLVKTKMIGREAFLDLIKTAIKAITTDKSKKPYVFYFEGDGGIGKTRFQEEVGVYVESLQERGKRIRCSDIIDLYHSDMHSNSRIEEALIAQLDPDKEFFQAYEEARKRFEAQRHAGLSGLSLEKERLALTEAFTEGFQKLSKAYLVVLRFDTLELVQYESGTVRTVCEVEDEASAVKNWLLEQVGQFANTVTVFTGRPYGKLKSDFANYFEEKWPVYTGETIKRFTEEEAAAYLCELAERKKELKQALFPNWEAPEDGDETESTPLPPEEINPLTFQQIYRGSDNGRPIYINLLADLLSFPDTEIGDIFPPFESEDDVKKDLPAIIRDTIAKRLMKGLPLPESKIVEYLVYARQGLDLPLLLHLVDREWGEVEAARYMEKLRQYTFIKTHPQTPGILFLHDEVYDLLDEFHLKEQESSEPEKIRTYYQKEYETVQQKIRQIWGRPGPQAQAGREDLMRKRDDLRATLLYYQLQVDPLKGFFRYYLRWAEIAVKGNQAGHDMRLRDVVLGFLKYLHTDVNPRKQWLAKRIDIPAFDRIFALLWVRRYVARGQFEKAYRVAQKLRNSADSTFKWAGLNDDLYKGLLLMLSGEARLAYTPRKDENTAQAFLRQAAEILEPRPEKFDEDRDEEWRWARTLGRAYSNIGYDYRSRNQFASAVAPNRKAIVLYREVDIRDEMADSLNNLSFVYAKLGAIDEALALAEDARDLRENLYQRYPLGLSFNTLAVIHLEARHPHQSLALAKRALQLFTAPGLQDEQAVGNKRGRAFSQFTQGKAYRGLAGFVHSGVYNRQDVERFLENGRNALENALDLFGNAPGIYQLEARAELGRLYRDWMRLFLLFDDQANARERQKLALLELDNALQVARQLAMKDQEANLLHDIAQLYWILKDENKTRHYLEQAAICIPIDYQPRLGSGFAPVEIPINPFWVIQGKVYLLEAELIFQYGSVVGPLTEEQVDAILASLEKRLLAVACFEQYSNYYANPLMRSTRRDLYNSLKWYGIPRLQLISDKTQAVAQEYKLDLQTVQNFMLRTIGIFATVTE